MNSLTDCLSGVLNVRTFTGYKHKLTLFKSGIELHFFKHDFGLGIVRIHQNLLQYIIFTGKPKLNAAFLFIRGQLELNHIIGFKQKLNIVLIFEIAEIGQDGC